MGRGEAGGKVGRVSGEGGGKVSGGRREGKWGEAGG